MSILMAAHPAAYVIGARFVCLSCRERGIVAMCGRCGRKALDLADAADRAALSARWSSAPAFEAGLGLWSWRNLRKAGRLRWATGLMMAFVIVGAGISAIYNEPPKTPA